MYVLFSHSVACDVAVGPSHQLQHADLNGTIALPECLPCPQGAVCEGGKAIPYPVPGYWQETVSGLVLKCNSRDMCPGGGPRVCAQHHEGFLCGACSDGYAIFLGRTLCSECVVDTIGALLLGALYFAIFTFICTIIARGDGAYKGLLFSLLVTFLQDVAVILEIEHEPGHVSFLRKTLGKISSFLLLDVRFLGASCAIPDDPVSGVLLASIAPFALVVVIAIFYLCAVVFAKFMSSCSASTGTQRGISGIGSAEAAGPSRNRGASLHVFSQDAESAQAGGATTASDRAGASTSPAEAPADDDISLLTPHLVSVRNTLARATTLMLQWLYLTTCRLAFAALNCTDRGHGVSALVAYPDVRCDSSRFWLGVVLSSLLICVYIVGAPLCIAIAGMRAPKPEKGVSIFLAAQWEQYREGKLWWLSVVLLWRATIVAISTFLVDAPDAQVAGYVTIIFGMAVLEELTSPYRLPSISHLSKMLYFALFLSAASQGAVHLSKGAEGVVSTITFLAVFTVTIAFAVKVITTFRNIERVNKQIETWGPVAQIFFS
jgi:hypothetical protein